VVYRKRVAINAKTFNIDISSFAQGSYWV